MSDEENISNEDLIRQIRDKDSSGVSTGGSTSDLSPKPVPDGKLTGGVNLDFDTREESQPLEPQSDYEEPQSPSSPKPWESQEYPKEHKHNEGQELAPVLPHPVVSDPDELHDIAPGGKKNKEPLKLTLFSTVMAVVIILFVLWGISYAYKYFGLYSVSPHTIHWHADLVIDIRGKRITVPPSIGIKDRLDHPSVIHTHEADNIVHMHNEGRVLAREVMLREFFEIWGEAFNKNEIMGYKRDVDGTLFMLVNGEINRDFERYVMQDGDRIEIVLE